MAFIEIGFNTKRPLILGRGGFGTQLNDWLMDEGWGSADFLDDNAPDAVGGLRDYVDPAILKRGRPAFVALGDNKLRVELLQKLAAAGYSTPVFISDAASVSPSAVLEPGCIILPQALRSILPTGFNEVISLAKGTAMVYVLAMPELFYTIQMIYNRTQEVIPLLMVGAVWYLVITTVLSAIQHIVERGLARSERRSAVNQSRTSGRTRSVTTTQEPIHASLS